MTDGGINLGDTGLEPPAGDSAAAVPGPGWYPDPWVGGQHRYWDGNAWSSYTFPNGPAVAAPPSPAPVPGWGSESPERAERARGWPTGWPLAVITLVVGLAVGFAAVVGVGYAFGGSSKSKTPKLAQGTFPTPSSPTLPVPGLPAPPADSSASVLGGLVVRQADVGAGVAVGPLRGGNQVVGETTLDLCNGTFPSESLRTARLQVAVVDAQGNSPLSTEAVLYSNAAATSQAFTELRTVIGKCPSTPVTSPVGEPTVTTRFNAPPDGAWPATTGVERLAVDVVATDPAGQAQHFVAVYLRRGRVLMGLYFLQPDGAQPAVAGQTTIAGIVNVFAGRVAQLPASVVKA